MTWTFPPILRVWQDITKQAAAWSRLPLLPTTESCLLGIRKKQGRDKQKYRCAELAFVVFKRLIATQWKSPSAPDIHRWTSDLLHWANVELHALNTLRDIGVVINGADIWDSFVDQLKENDDTRTP
ncbi:hypothetical protein NDU88_004083 [Pleurodeles waltl]|uniref:Transposase n=1 Tax=Pleurodeles waltl TaxID=8319 RepID=A0AAV7NMI8_PLEWA|nr:hypothetical protein NDU88_004083 [Pleurodeles waltl]